MIWWYFLEKWFGSEVRLWGFGRWFLYIDFLLWKGWLKREIREGINKFCFICFCYVYLGEEEREEGKEGEIGR